MHTFCYKIHFLHLLLLLLTLNFFTPAAKQTPTNFCGKIRNQTPFNMTLCKSEKLYFRTSLGLFQISSIDYTNKLLTISHPTCSSATHFVSPSVLTSGFPSPQPKNSLILFNCSNNNHPLSPFTRNCSQFDFCRAGSAKHQEENIPESSSCLVLDDLENMGSGMDMKGLNCSHYIRVYRNSLNGVEDNGYELGTRISFDIPDHVPNICDECKKEHGNCGVGLRCICHPEQCKDKVISVGGSGNPFGNILLSLLSVIVLMFSS